MQDFVPRCCLSHSHQALKSEKEGIEAEIEGLAAKAAKDLGLELGKTIKLEWHK